MYSDPLFHTSEKAQFLIVKTSSLGDIIQSFSVLDYLKSRFPNAEIDWAVEKRFASVVEAHPLVRRALSFDLKGLRKKSSAWGACWRTLRFMQKTRYDAVFDLQGNTKSGVLTLLSRGAQKIGFGRKSVREWPNLLATGKQFEVSRKLNIRLQYVSLVQQFFGDESSFEMKGVRFKIEAFEGVALKAILARPALQTNERVMICPGSKWINKQLPLETLLEFLQKIERALHCSFLLVWGAEEEKEICQKIHGAFPDRSAIVDRLAVPVWQNLMNEADLVIAVDSSALHLCATTSTPSFSIFGPTSPEIFKPVGKAHFAYQGSCPYNKVFEKQCPLLRSCPTGACIRQLSAQMLFEQFWGWWITNGRSCRAPAKGH